MNLSIKWAKTLKKFSVLLTDVTNPPTYRVLMKEVTNEVLYMDLTITPAGTEKNSVSDVCGEGVEGVTGEGYVRVWGTVKVINHV
jgi:hypothetical protein